MLDYPYTTKVVHLKSLNGQGWDDIQQANVNNKVDEVIYAAYV